MMVTPAESCKCLCARLPSASCLEKSASSRSKCSSCDKSFFGNRLFDDKFQLMKTAESVPFTLLGGATAFTPKDGGICRVRSPRKSACSRSDDLSFGRATCVETHPDRRSGDPRTAGMRGGPADFPGASTYATHGDAYDQPHRRVRR